jgi:phenylacetate-CoA ligase
VVNWRASLYRVAHRFGRDHRFAILRDLRAIEGWSPGQLRDAQRARLASILLHAFEHVPHYRAPLVESGVILPGRTPRVAMDRFPALPLLERSAIREHRDALCDTRPPAFGNPRSLRRTGGTTGDPLWLVQDHVMNEHSGAVTLWFDEWSGHVLGQPKVILWGVGADGRNTTVSARLGRLLKNETLLPINALSDATMDCYLERIARRRPSQILGFAGAVHQVARRAEATAARFTPPRVVMVSAETMVEGMRDTVEAAFRAPVVNRYGTRETGGVACECRHRRGLHVSALTHLVEVLREDGSAAEPGEVGDVVITLLTNYSMPLIRYRIGDRGALLAAAGPCRCGRDLPTLATVVGRSLDAFVRRDGVWVHGVDVKRFYHRMPWIQQFQVVQLGLDRVLVRLVDREPGSEPVATRRGDLDAIRAYLRELMGAGCEVTFEFLAAIPREASGKYRQTRRVAPAGPER